MEDYLKEPGIKYGLYAGLVALIVQFGFFSFGADVYISMWIGVAWFAMLALAFVAGISELRSHGGFIAFPRALLIIYTVMIIGEFFAVTAEFINYNLIDPNFHEVAKEVKVRQTAESFEKIGQVIQYNDTDRDEIMQVVESADYQFYLQSAALKFVTWLFLDFIFALILAAIIRKDPPKSE